MSTSASPPVRIRLTEYADPVVEAGKLPPSVLSRVLGERQMAPHADLVVACEGAEDAGVFRLAPDRALVFSTDILAPCVDDPFVFGRIAACHALSDVFAMGAKPLAALNLVAFPRDLDPGILAEILAGGASILREASAAMAGGDSMADAGIRYGMAVTGEVHPDRVLRNRGVKPNDFLVLTKPLGTGLVSSSIRRRANRGAEVAEAVRWMTTLNNLGLDAILAARPNALTDVSGFGLLGHLSEMIGAEPLAATVRASSIPRLAGIEACFDRDLVPSASATNRDYVKERLRVDPVLSEWDRTLLLGPEISGGLLIALPPSRAEPLVRELRAAGLPQVAIIGSVEAASTPTLRVIA